MISTFRGLPVAVLAILPGAAYTFALERVAGSYGVSFSDRLVRRSPAGRWRSPFGLRCSQSARYAATLPNINVSGKCGLTCTD